MYFTALGYVIHSNLFKKKTLIESLLYTFIFIKVLFFKDKKRHECQQISLCHTIIRRIS